MSNNKIQNNIFSIAYILLNLIWVYLISVFEGKSIFFLALLGFNMLVFSVFSKKIDKAALIIARLLIGALFIYSGFVKGVDPLGTKYRIEDYFFAFNMAWANPFAFALSLFLNTAEFALGVALIFNYRIRLMSGLASLMMIIFTFVTLNDALHNPVPDCGCFGDALIISNWQTFYKNLVINALLFPIFFNRFKLSALSKRYNIIAVYSIIVLFLGLQIYSSNHLPLIDFRSWKVGTKLLPDNPKPIKYYVTYKHKNTGKTKEFLSNELPWQDSVFMANYEFESSRVVDPNSEQSKVIPMLDENSQDVSKDIVSSKKLTFLMIINNLDKIDKDVMHDFKEIKNKATAKGYNFIILNSSTPDKFKSFINDYGFQDVMVYTSDDIDLKTIIRSNPGLILVKNAVVVNKYHYNSLKSFDDIISENN